MPHKKIYKCGYAPFFTNYLFSIPEKVTGTVENGTAEGVIDILQGQYLEKQFLVDSSQNQKFVLPNDHIDTSTIRVNVRENSTSTTKTDGSRNHIFAILDFNFYENESYNSDLSFKLQKISFFKNAFLQLKIKFSKIPFSNTVASVKL